MMGSFQNKKIKNKRLNLSAVAQRVAFRAEHFTSKNFK